MISCRMIPTLYTSPDWLPVCLGVYRNSGALQSSAANSSCHSLGRLALVFELLKTKNLLQKSKVACDGRNTIDNERMRCSIIVSSIWYWSYLLLELDQILERCPLMFVSNFSSQNQLTWESSDRPPSSLTKLNCRDIRWQTDGYTSVLWLDQLIVPSWTSNPVWLYHRSKCPAISRINARN